MRRVLLLIVCLTAFAGLMAADADWQPQVDRCIAQGEFARAEKIMKSLPKKVRRADAVRIDSLQTIMQRIRKDFNMTPERVPD